ncbi:hypothetical protein AK812_SmicGene4095 [Symbiodinium microadriaticum]|uniref:Uncharacterized protein n=1 Tax=Symbiodinium microadriaticum TaxID=2951 RepID=A0A1Q9EX78_SYMMI|nr:hypothetical protein AK812_SmicGene4095 [Symbiodinium microadriaticum]
MLSRLGSMGAAKEEFDLMTDEASGAAVLSLQAEAAYGEATEEAEVAEAQTGMSTISPRHFDDEVDDVTAAGPVGLQVQQFLDEWHFRAMDIFEASGMHITQEEKEQLANLDEEWMIEGLVQRMPGAMKKTIATRVRNALEEGSPDEVAKIMDDGDTGITQQVLKEVVTEAGREAGSDPSGDATLGSNGSTRCWKDHDHNEGMALRIARLIRCSEEADQVQLSIERFPKEQNAKTQQAVVLSLIENRRQEKRLESKFSSEVEGLDGKLFNCKASQLTTVRSVINRKAADEQDTIQMDVYAAWKRYVYMEADSREAAAKLKEFEDAVKASEVKVREYMKRFGQQEDLASFS